MPSLEARYQILNRSGHSIALRGAFSQNSKVPTLNDRYWGGDYLYLKSESAFTTEGGADYSWFAGTLSADLFGTFYQSKVTDWIRWLPAGVVWRPQNIPEVLSKGAEAGIRVSAKIARWNLSLNSSYAYTNIRMIKGKRSQDPAIGQQLAYQPKHSWRATIKAEKGRLSVYSGLYYTGQRTTIDLYDLLPSYLLTNLGVNYSFVLFNQEVTANGVLKNIFNVRYQNVKFYAMPGRNYQVTLQWKF
jgi:iron complex outermembrane receptor protein